jgi:DNA-directed RNA polymerase subunit RPC12/RpoP
MLICKNCKTWTRWTRCYNCGARIHFKSQQRGPKPVPDILKPAVSVPPKPMPPK